MTDECDVLVVGAGPAGCSAAIFAARRGFKVILADKARFPRDKVCGDGLTPAAQVVLDRLGVLGAIEDSNPWKTRRIVIYPPKGEALHATVPSSSGRVGAGIVLPRRQLDNILFERAASTQNVETLENCEVLRLLTENGTIRGCEGTRHGRSLALRARWVIAADGARSNIASELSLSNEVPRHRGLAMRAYFENVEGLDDCVEFHYCAEIMPAYAWIFPTGDRTANVGLGVVSAEDSKKDIRRLFAIFVSNNPIASRKLRNATMVERSLRGWSLPFGSFRAKRSSANVLLAGDAASFVDPLSGEGISYALRSGELAAQAIADSLLEADSRISTAISPASRYERLWRKEFSWREFLPGYLVQRLIHRPRVLETCIRSAVRNPRRASILGGALLRVYPKCRLLLGL